MTTTALWLWLLGPAALLLVPAARGRRAGGTVAAVHAAATANLGLAVVMAAVLAGAGELRAPLLGIAGVGISLHLDALSATVYLLVSFLGWVVLGFSRHYLDGDPGQARFFAGLGGALACVLLVVAAGNLLALAIAWAGTAVHVDRLLRFYPDRPAAVLAARKKFLASRLGDLCLLGAMLLLWSGAGTLEIADLRTLARADVAALAAVLPHAAGLLVAAALLKSAPFPLHGWITEVMEAPTPLSAFLHAGVINAGGYLLLRHADLVASQPGAMTVLVVAGTVTAAFGALAMLPQTSVKGALAHSTIAQMGFMLLQCGLGAFASAALHLVAHSLYKAHAFLASGDEIARVRARTPPTPVDPAGRRRRTMLGVIAAPVVAYAVAAVFSGGLAVSGTVLALGTLLLIGLAGMFAAVFDGRASTAAMLGGLALAATVVAAYFLLQAGAAALLAGVVPAAGAPAWLVAIPTVAFGALALWQAAATAAPDAWRAVYTHAAAGFYVNAWVNRQVLRWWPGTSAATATLPSGVAP